MGGAGFVARMHAFWLAGASIAWAPLRRVEQPLAVRYFADVAPFATLRDEVNLEEIQARWLGYSDEPLYLTPESAELLPAILGREPNAGQVVDEEQLLAQLEAMPGALGIVPFHRLTPRLKALQRSPLSRIFVRSR